MGRKKSVVLTVLLAIVVLVLSVLTFGPKVSVGAADKFNAAIFQYDLSMDLGGGTYAYYYPAGVISEAEYKNNVQALEGNDLVKYEDSYFNHKGLYLSYEGKYGIYSGNDNNPVSADFKAEFDKAAQTIASRFEEKGYADYRVSVVDDYAIRVQLPASEVNAGMAHNYLSKTGELTLKSGGNVITELTKKDAKVSDLISSISVSGRYDTSYIKIKLTSAGEDMIERIKDGLSESTAAGGSSTASVTTLDFVIGTETICSVYKDSITSSGDELRVLGVEDAYADQIEFVAILLDSAMNDGGYDINFTVSDMRSFESVYGENTKTLLYIALGVILLAMLVLPVVVMGKHGVVNIFVNLSYTIIVGLCYAFISGGIFEVTLGSILLYIVGLALINGLQYHIYCAIKSELAQFKTAESSVKGGYRKTIFTVVDIYAVLLMGALAFLIGVGGGSMFAVQALICVISAAFINLLWARAINFLLMSASKDKYKYFRFVREDDEDDE